MSAAVWLCMLAADGFPGLEIVQTAREIISLAVPEPHIPPRSEAGKSSNRDKKYEWCCRAQTGKEENRIDDGLKASQDELKRAQGNAAFRFGVIPMLCFQQCRSKVNRDQDG